MQSEQKKPAIRSRKHATPIQPLVHGTALAMLATLALPAAQASDSAEPKVMPEVRIEGKSTSDFQVQKSANEKFSMPLLDTPKSVTVIPSEVISQTGAVSLADALRTVPGITIGAAEGG